jgi:putative endonuclease
MYYVYVLQSEKDSSTYIGMTQRINDRILGHNSGKTKSIKHLIPLNLIYFEAYKTKKQARKRELKLKNSASEKKRLFKRLNI